MKHLKDEPSPDFFVEWLGLETSPLPAQWTPGMGTWNAAGTDRTRRRPAWRLPWSKPRRSGPGPWLCTTPYPTGRTASPSTGRSSYSQRTTSLGNTQGESLNGHILPFNSNQSYLKWVLLLLQCVMESGGLLSGQHHGQLQAPREWPLFTHAEKCFKCNPKVHLLCVLHDLLWFFMLILT